MLRRRRKMPRDDKHAPRTQHGAPRPQDGAPRSRRRARPDTPVPAELKLPPGGLPAIAEAKPAAKAPRTEKPRDEAMRPTPRREEPPPARREVPPPPARRETPRRDDERVILVTGFDPFGGERLNPSWEVCNRLPRTIAGHRVETCRVPCEFRRAIEVVAEAIERHRPGIVICLGQAGGRTHMSVERVAINVDDARLNDNAGAQPLDEPIAANGPAAYFATVPIKAMAQAMRKAGAPAEVSNTAGTYVCNHLMYGVLHFLAGSGREARAGFIHVPYAEEQVVDTPDRPSLALATMVKGVEAAVAAAVTHTHDIAAAEGKLD
jgi:pyroglutamyl-peptidase